MKNVILNTFVYQNVKKSFIALLANITNGLDKISYHAVLIYDQTEDLYKIKDPQGKKFTISKNRCTVFQVRSFASYSDIFRYLLIDLDVNCVPSGLVAMR